MNIFRKRNKKAKKSKGKKWGGFEGMMMQCPRCKQTFSPTHWDKDLPMKCPHCKYSWEWVEKD